MLFAQLVEDDCEGKLHLLAVEGSDSDSDSDSLTDGGAPMGIVFWRELSPEEMRAWIKVDKLAELAGSKLRQLKGKGEGKGEGEGEGEREGESDFRKRAKWAKELDKTFRINLRFLADIRNVCLVVIILKVLF